LKNSSLCGPLGSIPSVYLLSVIISASQPDHSKQRTKVLQGLVTQNVAQRPLAWESSLTWESVRNADILSPHPQTCSLRLVALIRSSDSSQVH
jgi:hypothetical protein